LTVRGRPLPDGFWTMSTPEVTRSVLGMVLVSDIGGERTAGRIVEAEAYLKDDPASHSSRGITKRNAPMFGPPGLAYVYFTYGNHWCLNFVTAPKGHGEAVLIRALEPLEGLDAMARRRGRAAPRDLLSGPGKICQAMGIDGSLNGHPLALPPLTLLRDRWEPGEIAARPRIGISQSVDKPWRLYPVRSREWVSRR